MNDEYLESRLDNSIIKELLNLFKIQYLNRECRTKSKKIIGDLADHITAYLLNHYDDAQRSSINATTTDPLKNSIQRLKELSARFEFDNQPINDLHKHLNDIYYQLNHEESLYPLTVETQLRSIDSCCEIFGQVYSVQKCRLTC